MTAPLDIPRDLVSDARSQTRNALGADLEVKASDAFCLNVLRDRQPSGSRASALLGHLVASAVGRPAPPSLLELATEDVSHATPTTTSPSGPDARLVDARTAALRTIGAVYDELERQFGDSPLHTEICWLNRSLRTWANPRAFADVASDPTVVAVDVSRRLVSEGATSSNGEVPAHDDLTRRNDHLVVSLRSDLEVTGRGLVVAVIDSEVDATHSAFEGRVNRRRNFTNEPWGRPHPHGTALSGIIASADAACPGVAPEVVVNNYKVLATKRRHNADDFGAALALQHALEDGATVATCAWGAGPIEPRASRSARAVDQAWALGMVVVKSAGNRGPRAHTMSTPADAADVFVVGATDLLGTRVQPYSSRGPVGGRPGPHCVAPGGTWGTDAGLRLTCALVGGGFGHLDVGTSFAAAFVSGAAVLHLACDPSLRPDDVRRRLVDDAVALVGDQGPEAQGAGLLTIRL